MRIDLRVWFLTGVLCVLSGVSSAQQARTGTEAGRGPGHVAAEPGAEAMRREVEARDRERERMFARARALEPLARPIEAIREQEVRLLMLDRIRVPFPQPVVVKDQFNALVFGTVDPADMKTLLDDLLDRKVRTAGAEWGLTPPQERRLRLAGQGDIKRAFDEVEEKRKQFNIDWQDLKRRRAFLESIGPLRIRIQSPSADGDSLFSKTLRRIRDEQLVAGRRGARP